MVQKWGKRKVIIALAIILVVLAAIGVFNVINMNNKDKSDPYVPRDTSSSETDIITPTDEAEPETDAPEVVKDTEPSDSSAIDPATVTTVDIAPMTITVSYVKGVGGFDYQVLRTTNGTHYVEFSSSELVGTKCTNDIGVFASVLADPDTNESTTLAKTTTVDGTKYGLSLEPSTCTSNEDKLQAYQKSFSDAFSLLKKMN